MPAMPEHLDQLAAAGWSGVAAVIAGLLWWLLSRRASRKEDADKVAQTHREEYMKTKLEWRDAVKAGQAELVAVLARKLDWMRAQGWHLGLAAMLATAALLAGCRSAPVRIVALGEHVRIMRPGDVLPPLPAGEDKWWCATDTGLASLLPQDAPATQIKEK